jgi:hypothetical protein
MPVPEDHPKVLVCIQRIWAMFWIIKAWRFSGMTWQTGILTIFSL